MGRPILALAGISHRTSPVEERERLAFAPHELGPALQHLKARLGAAVVLSTCNRTELYTHLREEGEASSLVRILMELKGVELAPAAFYVLRQEEAVQHLFRVAAGLDSLAVGEEQILGQVREALALAAEARSVDGVLSRLFHRALATGRRVRRETALGRWASSVSRLAVTVAARLVDDLGRATALVVSAGAMGKLTARALRGLGAGRVLVTSRTYERALALARALGAEAVPMHRLTWALAQADVVVTATGAPSFVLDRPTVEEAMAHRPQRPLVIVDIAVPRDVDPQVAQVPLVRLLDIDDLGDVIPEEGRSLKALAQAEAIVQEEVEQFWAWYRTLDVTPLIARLRQQAEEVKRRELERTLRRMPHLSPQDRRRVEAMATAITNKLLHHPIVCLKRRADAATYKEVVADLFALGRDGSQD